MTVNTQSSMGSNPYKDLYHEFEDVSSRLDREGAETLRRLKQTNDLLTQRLGEARQLEEWKQLPWYKQLFTPVPKPGQTS
ncbi:hypothetical protein A7979_09385 [Rothia nasimurium]|uniref:Uncharacterized protein n=1 Tax=Rothia nasimurium TaxID=85336 RepID=A0A1Y1RS29_9MICC|nr:hypothetical protein [Rothia nasimurium]ORC24483.1 hypothetical protein A7979_09385 [Rothia nasimurium]